MADHAGVTELLAQIEAGLDGVTGGQWHTAKKHPRHVCNSIGFKVAKCLLETKGISGLSVSAEEAEHNADHIARCDPDNMRTIIDSHRALEAERDRLKKDTEFLHKRRGELVIERDRLKEGIDRLALPIAFGPTGMPDQETIARMTYAHAIAQGRTPEQAEQDARALADREDGA